jgi:PAS domain-containing protein
LATITDWSELAEARRLARQAAEAVDADLADSAELVASELLTNALLHGGGWARLAVDATPQGVRVTVADKERRAPVVAVASDASMTGRGLRLVSALSAEWGVTLRPDGKAVWAELAPGPIDTDPDALLLLFDDELEPDHTGRFHIVLGEVPTDLLLRAKTHVDNVIREFKLTAVDAEASGDLSTHLSELIDTVVHRFVEAREGIKRQAVAAHEAGLARTRIELHLGPEAADAGEAYLAALDEVDAYCRAMRLLTLETPPEQRVFRRWYVEELVRQVRAAVAGEAPPPARTLEERLLQEVASVAETQRASERAARLADVAVALSGANSAEDVSSVVLHQGVAALAASGAGVVLAAEGAHLRVTGTVGYDADLVERLRNEPPDADLPAAHALRTGEAVWLESPEQRDARFPALRGMENDTVSMCAVPLVIGDHPVGALRFSFGSARLFDDEERRFVLALAAQCAQALERSRLERQAHEDQFRQAIESMLDPVMICRIERDESDVVVDLRIEYLNEAASAGGSGLGRLLSEHWSGIRQQGLLQRYLDVAATGVPLALDSYRYVDPVRPEVGGVFDLRATRIGELVFIVYRDVSERVGRELEVRRHQEALAEAQRIAKVGSWRWDAATGDDEWSVQMFEICGIDPGDPRPGRERFLGLLADDGSSRFLAAMDEAAEGDGRVQLELRLVRPDGDVRDVIITGEVLVDAAGEVQATRGTIQDVTDRRFVELALRRSEERLRREHENVEILQAAILPAELPTIPGTVFVARYLAASEHADVGGDFYDAFILGDGRVLVTVGDVAGKGIAAAEAVGQLRNSLRMAAIVEADPERVVVRLNELIELGFSAPFATAIIGIFEPAAGRFRWASAGHLPLVLRTAAGEVELVGGEPTHPPLGVSPRQLRGLHEVVLGPGAELLLFSDGLVERRGEDLDTGFARLMESVRVAPRDPQGVATTVLAGNLGEDRRDDVCLVLLARLALVPDPTPR